MTAYSAPSDPTNVVGRRVAAFAIDLLVVLAATLAVVVPAFTSRAVRAPIGTVECIEDNQNGFDNDFNEGFNDGFNASAGADTSFCFESGDEVIYIPAGEEGGFTSVVWGASIGFQALNLLVLQGLTGASIGKLVLGLRVVREDGQKAGFGWIALRWVLLYVDSFCCFLPGAVLVFSTKGHRRLGDMAAGTYVVRKDSMGTPIMLGGTGSGPAAGPWATPPAGSWGTTAGSGAWPPAGSGTFPGNEVGGSPWTPPPGGSPAGGPPVGGPPAGGTPPGSGAVHGEGPTWDPARNAYIQFDRDRGAWLQWDDDLKVWAPISQ